MEFPGLDIERLIIFVRDLQALGIIVFVQGGMDGKTSFGAGGANQLHHDLIAFQGLRPPRARNVAKHPVLDLVPLAGAGWKMTDFDSPPQFVGQLLEFIFPQAVARAVAFPAVCGHQQPLHMGTLITPPAQALPPGTDRGHGELSGVMANAYIHPRFVLPYVRDAVRHGFPFRLVRKIVRLDLDGLALAPPRPTGILVVANVLFLLGVD